MVMETLLLLSSLIELHQPTPFVIVAAVMAALLLLVSGFASGSEISYFSLSPNDLAELDTEHSRDRKSVV